MLLQVFESMLTLFNTHFSSGFSDTTEKYLDFHYNSIREKLLKNDFEFELNVSKKYQ